MFYFVLLSVIVPWYTFISALNVTEHIDTISCKPNLTNLKNEVVNLEEYCKDRPCISKCCGENEVLFAHVLNKTKIITCANVQDFKNWSLPLGYSNITINKSDYEKEIKSNKSFLKDFNLVQNRILLNKKCGKKWMDSFKKSILENGKFAGYVTQGVGWRIKEPEMYCVDRAVVQTKKQLNSYIWYFVSKDTTPDKARLIFISTGFLISSFFLVLVLLVYCMLPNLRNLSGMLLMAYVTTLLVVFLLKTFYLLSPRLSPKICANIYSPFLYFFFLSSILWLNIMSFDVWWSFRGMRLLREVNRKGELVKFGWYALYVWGVALAMTVTVVVVDKADLSRWPYIIKPSLDNCLGVVASRSLQYYWYTPIGILTLVNIVLFMMTVYNMWLVGKAVNRFNSASKTTQNKSKFRLYLKMSLVMGISWGIEVAESFYNDIDWPLWLFVLINLYNTVLGVVIFLLFIFNRNTMVALCKRYKIKCKFVQDLNKNSSTKSTTVSRSQSSTNKGSTYYSKTRSIEESEIEMDDTEVSKSVA